MRSLELGADGERESNLPQLIITCYVLTFSVVRAHSWNIARRSLFSLANWARMGVADRQPRILDPHFENISPRRLRS